MGPQTKLLQSATQVPTIDTMYLNGNSSEYVTFPQLPCFPWIHPHLHITSPSFSYSKPVRPLIDTGTYLDMIREDIAKELRLMVYEIETPQPVVGCFGEEASEKLQN